jgi:hypothetical protein
MENIVTVKILTVNQVHVGGKAIHICAVCVDKNIRIIALTSRMVPYVTTMKHALSGHCIKYQCQTSKNAVNETRLEWGNLVVYASF